MSDTPRPAIYWYSKSGNTRRAAEAFAQITGAEIVPIEVNRYRVPLLWMCRAIWDVGRSNAPRLRTGYVVPAKRPWIVVAGPIWADQLAPPGRSVLETLAGTSIPVGLLTTCGRSVEQVKYAQTAEAVLGRPLVAHVSIQSKFVGTEEMTRQITRFATAMAPGASIGAA
ncbi:hypothetical protein [uncultured Tateyamaria sp.]|uniref:hypothetical protein n=1 Tax=uncultured Tateyamaria sp. TaxID=455651 RepID=UPI002606683C|nr:hypothetical protein [uncultured Tateyamaria sp.]